MEPEEETVYKVVWVDPDSGRMSSCYVRGVSRIYYPVNEWIVHDTPMLVFRNIALAKKFCDENIGWENIEIWAGKGKDVVGVKYLLNGISFLLYDTVRSFWNQKDFFQSLPKPFRKIGMSLIPEGTCGTTELILTEQVY